MKSCHPWLPKSTSKEPCILFIGFEDPIDAMPMSEGKSK